MATKMTKEEAIKILMGYSHTPQERAALEVLIPELEESEDERIRRWLVDYFSSIDNAWIHKDITCIDILKWLEKQKEQKQEKFPPYVTGFKGDPDPAGTSDLEEAAKEYASKTLCDPDDGPSTGLAKKSFIAGAEWQKEQKPAEWSEEDEEILKLLILNIGRYKYFGGMSSERILAFLKSLRPQQRQEWSEEEKEILDSILSHYVLIDKPIDANGISKEKYISLIKSIRFDTYKNCNSHWKPSEDEERLINTSISFLKDFANKGYENAVECIDWLKSKLNGDSGK